MNELKDLKLLDRSLRDVIQMLRGLGGSRLVLELEGGGLIAFALGVDAVYLSNVLQEMEDDARAAGEDDEVDDELGDAMLTDDINVH